MRKIMSACLAVLFAALVVGAWAMTTGKGPIAALGTMNPFEMMKNSKDLPVQDIVDPI